MDPLEHVADFEDLVEANATYAASFASGGLAAPAKAGVAVVTCMDSRIDPLAMLGLGLGDAKVLRTAGGRVDHNTLESLVIAVHVLAVRRIMVVGHTRCAMASNTTQQIRENIEASAGQDASWLTFSAIPDQLESLADDVQKLRTHPLVPEDVIVGGFVYDVDTGLIHRKY